MEDKTFELLTKMYGEMQSGFARLDKKIDDKIDSVKKDIVKLESKMDENHKALYDGYKQCMEGINELRKEVKEIDKKVETQEIELRVIKGGK